MHRLADGVVPSECERQVRNTAGSICSRQVLLYPSDGFDEVNAVFGVLLDTCSYGKDIDIENNVMRRDVQLDCQQFICSLANLYLPAERGGLTGFVECHHHHCRSQRMDFRRLFQESLFTFLKADGVYNALSLSVLQTGYNGFPMR